MTGQESKRRAIVVLPAGMAGSISDPWQRRWLSRAVLRHCEVPAEILQRALSAAGLPLIEEGLAALRFWGQTGERPAVWIAAADPVYLEARLDHLCLHALGKADSTTADLQAIYDHLQASLGQGRNYAFACVGPYGYWRGDNAVATASVSAEAIDGLEPDEFMPSGQDTAGYHTLLGETQMCLHEHPVNRRREAEGLMPVNSVWFWGGGMAPQKKEQILPALIGDDPLFTGYWESHGGTRARWPGTFEKCLDVVAGDLVIVTPASGGNGDALTEYLTELRTLLTRGRLARLVLLFRDGLTAEVGRFDIFRVWRRSSPLL